MTASLQTFGRVKSQRSVFAAFCRFLPEKGQKGPERVCINSSSKRKRKIATDELPG
jgi:hypothetical protein